MITKRTIIAIALLWSIQFVTYAQLNEQQFKNPPPSARPRTWMHAMSSNMSKEGLTKDLEAMAEVGIGGIILFNVTNLIPKGNVLFNSPEHIEMIAHAAAECERLGLSFGIHNCDGWTSSGGPWVTPEHSMKQVVYSEQIVAGGQINATFASPSSVAGFYQDIAVLAYPSLAGEIADHNNIPTLKSSDPNLDLSILNDGKIDRKTQLNISGNSGWVEFQYHKPFTLRSVYLNFHTRVSQDVKILLKVSDDGVNFTKVTRLKHERMGKIEHGIDAVLDGITSKYFRIESPVSLDLTEINLSAVQHFDHMLARTSLFKIENHRIPNIAAPNADEVIHKNHIINLTAAMDEHGVLQTKLPKGNWTIMRFGYTIMGAVNGPASDEGRGWEVDKMSRESFKTFYEGYVRNVINASRKVAPHALQYLEIDSYEVGGQNWTKTYPSAFKKELAYDILQYLPLYAGRYINNAETTERILWDIRNFNSKLMTNNYFDYFSELCHKDGLLSYVEPYSFNAGFNELDATKNVDIPMGEFWMHQRYQTETAVSGARIYGKNKVSAESFSAHADVNWKGHPGTLKLTGDKAWTLGINEFFFHRFAHQANTHVKPGMTMSKWGSHIDRTQTWWENAGKAWFTYLARGQYILRHGIPVSNLLVFVGDGSPNSIVNRNSMRPKLPNHINFDCINMDALAHRITVNNGKLILPNGIQYRALHLFNVAQIRLSTLKIIAALAEEGIPIIGEKPRTLGGLTPSAADREEFDVLVHRIWSKPTTHKTGDWDAIFAKHHIPIDLKIEGGKDITYIHRTDDNQDIYFFFNPDSIQRTYPCTFNVAGKIPELWDQMTGEIAKMGAFKQVKGQTKANITLPAEGSVFVVFREPSEGVRSVLPQHSDAKIAYILTENNQLTAQVKENTQVEVLFNSGDKQRLKVTELPKAIQINGSWKVTFPDIKAEEQTFDFRALRDWTDHQEENIKYYSGTAIYETTFVVNKTRIAKNLKQIIDLGEVHVAARIILNGKDLGVMWIKPFKMDVTSALKVGENSLRIELTNVWTNRLIGDENYDDNTQYSHNMEYMPSWYTQNEAPDLGKRHTWCTYPFYKKGDALMPSGLLGPVKIETTKTYILK